MMVMNYFCGVVDRRKAFSFISSRDHCQRFSPLQISNMLPAGFEPAQNLSSGFVEWSCAVVITTAPRHQTKMDFKQNCYGSWKYYKAATFKSFLHLSYKNTQLLFWCFLIFSWDKHLTDDFWSLHKNMNCTFLLMLFKLKKFMF